MENMTKTFNETFRKNMGAIASANASIAKQAQRISEAKNALFDDMKGLILAGLNDPKAIQYLSNNINKLAEIDKQAATALVNAKGIAGNVKDILYKNAKGNFVFKRGIDKDTVPALLDSLNNPFVVVKSTATKSDYDKWLSSFSSFKKRVLSESSHGFFDSKLMARLESVLADFDVAIASKTKDDSIIGFTDVISAEEKAA